MGLDMYLKLVKREYSSESKWDNGEKTCEYPKEFEKFGKEIKARNFKSMEKTTSCQIGYWRKANAIHKWFIDNCADGDENATQVNVPLEKIKELLDVCKYVRENPDKASEKLPTCKGFFFGSQEYDMYYFDDLNYTIDLLEKVVNFFKDKNGYTYSVEYEPSW